MARELVMPGFARLSTAGSSGGGECGGCVAASSLWVSCVAHWLSRRCLCVLSSSKGLCGHVTAVGRVDVLSVSLFMSSSCIHTCGSIGGLMYERAKRRAYHSNGSLN